MVNPHADPTFVVDHIVDAIRNRFAQLPVFEVMDANLFGVSPRSPFAPTVGKIPDQFLLFRVHRDNRLALSLKELNLLVNLLKLSVAIGMLFSFARFTIGLQAISRFVQQLGNRARPDGMIFLRQFLGQAIRTLTCPPQWRLRIASRHRLDQGFQCIDQIRIVVGCTPPSTTRASNPLGFRRTFLGRQPEFSPSSRNGCLRKSRSTRDGPNTAIPQLTCFRRRPLTPNTLIHFHCQRPILAPDTSNNLSFMHSLIMMHLANLTNTSCSSYLCAGPNCETHAPARQAGRGRAMTDYRF